MVVSRTAVVIVATAVLLAGCRAGATPGPAGSPAIVDGVVTAVEGTSPTELTTFTLRTSDGRLVHFSVGQLDLSDDAFPAGHLREHLATAVPVRVTYVIGGGATPVAIRLEDAPT